MAKTKVNNTKIEAEENDSALEAFSKGEIKTTQRTGLIGVGLTSIVNAQADKKLTELKADFDTSKYRLASNKAVKFNKESGEILIPFQSTGPSNRAHLGILVIPVGSNSNQKIKLQLSKESFLKILPELPREQRIEIRESGLKENEFMESSFNNYKHLTLKSLGELPSEILSLVLEKIPNLKTNYPNWSPTADSLRRRIRDALRKQEDLSS